MKSKEVTILNSGGNFLGSCLCSVELPHSQTNLSELSFWFVVFQVVRFLR